MKHFEATKQTYFGETFLQNATLRTSSDASVRVRRSGVVLLRNVRPKHHGTHVLGLGDRLPKVSTPKAYRTKAWNTRARGIQKERIHVLEYWVDWFFSIATVTRST